MIITLSHQKGGSAASTTAVMLAYALKGLAVDLDPQGSLSAALRIPGMLSSAYIGLEENDLRRQIIPGNHGGPLIGSDPRLSRLTTDPGMDRLVDLMAALDPSPGIIDTAGSRDSLTIAAARAADIVLVPTQLNDTDLHSQVAWIQELQKLGLGDRIMILPTRVNQRLGDNAVGLEILEAAAPGRVLSIGIPQKAEYGRLMTAGKVSQEIIDIGQSIFREIYG